MNLSLRLAFTLCVAVIFLNSAKPVSAKDQVVILIPPSAHPRIEYGVEKLFKTLQDVGMSPVVLKQNSVPLGKRAILVTGGAASSIFGPENEKTLASVASKRLGDEGYVIQNIPGSKNLLVASGGYSGALYGCLELAERVKETGQLPEEIDVSESPKMKLRGTCLLWMKQARYDWPVTSEQFPWFFDRKLMLDYLDYLAENRFNTLYFWNGHPFPYLLNLEKYPEARVLSDAELQKNIDYFKWFTAEADRRGIWTILHFYNIHVSPAFAEAHKAEGVKVENSRSTPLLMAYTRYCIREFINSYPNVGLLVCAGEALGENKEEWIRDAILAGVKDTGQEPPVIVREWTIDPDRLKEKVVPHYRNLFTMMKHNVEMIVSSVPDPRNAQWLNLGRQHVINLHLVSDIVPFRWGSPAYIREMVQNWVTLGATGAHIYPQVSWRWPAALDKVTPPLRVTERDWIYLEALGRYLWNSQRDAERENEYWLRRLEDYYGSRAAAVSALSFYETSGPVLPAIQNLLSIYNMGFYPTVVANLATLNGILKSIRIAHGESPHARPLDNRTIDRYLAKYGRTKAEGDDYTPVSVRDYVARVAQGKAGKSGVDPLPLLDLIEQDAAKASQDAEQVSEHAKKNRPEATRLRTDAEAIRLIAGFYRLKVSAAIHKGLYDSQGGKDHLNEMLQDLAQSVAAYRQLVSLTDKTYEHATDLVDWLNWRNTLDGFERELEFYRQQAGQAQTGAAILGLGVNGPFEDGDNAFYWSLESAARVRKLPVSTYLIHPGMLGGARLVVAFDMNDPWLLRHREEIRAWVSRGGRLLIWDEQARLHNVPDLIPFPLSFAGPSDFTTNNSKYRIRFADVEHPLLKGLRGRIVEKTSPREIPSSIRSYADGWELLAYTYAMNKDAHMFWTDYGSYGPKWVALADMAMCPLILEASVGTGKIAIMQLGRWKGGTKEAGEFCRALAINVLDWAPQR